MIRQLVRDAMETARVMSGGEVTVRSVARAVLFFDSYGLLALTRLRNSAKDWHVPAVGVLVRRALIALYSAEIGNEVELGDGVCFVHTIGTVLGGDARIGRRVRFMGNNTVGTAKDNGYPVIEDDVVVGVGARILGPIRVGARAVIGANAVVVSDVPPDSVAVGIPATVRSGVSHLPYGKLQERLKQCESAG
jgi:serine O-acetyltransferase